MNRKYTIAIILSLLISVCLLGQENNEKVPIMWKNKISADFGSIVSNVESISPVANVRYVRKFKNNFGIGVGYQHFNAHYRHNADKLEFNSSKNKNTSSDAFQIISNAIYLRFDYDFRIRRNLSLCTYMQTGWDWKSIYVSSELWAKDHADIVVNGINVAMQGLQVEYAFSNLSAYFSYEFCQNRLAPELCRKSMHFSYLFNHRIGLGVAYAF